MARTVEITCMWRTSHTVTVPDDFRSGVMAGKSIEMPDEIWRQVGKEFGGKEHGDAAMSLAGWWVYRDRGH